MNKQISKLINIFVILCILLTFFAARNNLRQAYDFISSFRPDWRGHFDIIGHSYGGTNSWY